MLRRFPSMTQESAELYASQLQSLATKARGVVRDLEPAVRLQHDSQRVFGQQRQCQPCVPSLTPRRPRAPRCKHPPCAALQNELQYLRIRAKRHEIMVAYGEDFDCGSRPGPASLLIAFYSACHTNHVQTKSSWSSSSKGGPLRVGTRTAVGGALV